MTNASISQAERIDSVCDRFEAEWRAGRAPRIDDFLAEVSKGERPAIRDALVAVESELRGASDTSITRSSVRNDASPDPERTAYYKPALQAMPESIGRFKVLAVLGNGAFGKVYRAEDPHLGRQVAVKVPLETAVRTGEEREKFLKEARAAANINHPNICQIHEVGEYENMPYIVMALVNGQSLSDMLKARKQPMGGKQAAIVTRKLALALAVAHEKGIVHRDLKPANIMYDSDRKDVVVMDFGLARGPRLGDARGTQSGIIMGTPAYMSPEQARGDSKDVGPSGDIYSLGVILYELLTNTRPFIGTATEVIGQILHVEPEPPSKRKAGLDPRLEAVCMKAMAKNPAARYKSMREVAAAIDPILRAPAPGLPAKPGMETVRVEKTKNDGALTTSENQKLENVFQAIFEERKTTKAETAAAIEAAVKKHRTPRWMFVLLAFLAVAGCAGIIFFTKSDKVKVSIELTDVNLADKSLSFFLDEEPISADALANPLELKPGEHRLVVKRGKDIVKQLNLTVTGGRSPGIKVTDVTPDSVTPPVETDLAKWQGTWKCVSENTSGTPLTAEELKSRAKVMTIAGNRVVVERTLDGRPTRFSGTFRLNSAASPKEFDFEGTNQEDVGYRQSGVFEFDGPRLRLVYRFAQDGKPLGRATARDVGQPNVVQVEFERVEVNEAGFVPLFNGKDLTGWKTHPDEPGNWKVENGVLVGRGPSSALFTERGDYTDFHFFVEARINAEAFGGLNFRAQQIKAGPTFGYSALIDSVGKFGDRTGTLYVLAGDPNAIGGNFVREKLVTPDTWFTQEVIAQGNHIVIKVNGKVVTDYLDKNYSRGHLALWLWHPTVIEFRQIKVKELVPPKAEVLFLGDSITQGWEGQEAWKKYFEPLKAANFGIRAGKTGDVLSGIKDGKQFEGTTPKVAVLLVGTNNIVRDSAEEIAAGIEQIVKTIQEKSSTTKVLLLGIFPRGEAPGTPIRTKLAQVNAIIAKLDDGGKTVKYLDLGPKFLQEDGSPSRDAMPDYLHLSSRGYEIWAEAMEPILKEMLRVDRGFVPLFNGRDLAGWRTHESQPGDWQVLNGVILCGLDKAGPTHLYSARDDYKDFHLRMDVRLKDGSTGAMYRAPFGPTLGIKKEWVAGYNAKFDATRRGGIIVDQDRALHRLREIEIKDGEWAKFEIIARGDRHIVKLNGETTADYTDPNPRYRSGHIVLQKHGTKAEVAFRNIEIQEFGAADPDRAAAERVIALGGTVTLQDKLGVYDAKLPLPAGSIRPDRINANPIALTPEDWRLITHAGAAKAVGVHEVPAGGWKDLERMTSLLSFQTTSTEATAQDFESVAALVNLRSLVIYSPKLNDDDLKFLDRLPNLEVVNFRGTVVGDAGLARLAKHRLRELFLGDTRVTDAGMVHVAKIAGLQWLNLDGTGIGDAGLKELAGLKDLRKLDLHRTKTTPEARREFRREHPECKITPEDR